VTRILANIRRRMRYLLGLNMPDYDPIAAARDEEPGVWYWACIYAWVMMIGALLSVSIFMAGPLFIAEIGVILIVAFPLTQHLHYTRHSWSRVTWIVFSVAIVTGAIQFGPTIATYSRYVPSSNYEAVRFILGTFLWVMAFRALSMRTITELVQTILPATSIVLLSLVVFPHYTALLGMGLLILGALALLSLEHRLSARRQFTEVSRARFTRARRSSGALYSWPALYVLALLVAVVVGFWTARTQLSSTVTQNIQIYLARVVVRHFMTRMTDYTPPVALWLPRLSPPEGRQIIMEVICERPTNWRTTAYTKYSKRTWHRGLALERARPIAEGRWQIPLEGSGVGYDATEMVAHFRPHVAFATAIPVPLYPVSFELPVRDLRYRTDGTVGPRDYLRGNTTYTVISRSPPTLPTARGIEYPISEEDKQANLELPEDLDPRIRNLAETLTAEETTVFDKVRAIELHLAYEYEYDLRAPSGWPDELVSAFLFRTRRGYCYHFATAMVLMCRSIGVPARLAVGFMRGEARDTEEDLYVVRGEDAHAWPEIYMPYGGWMMFEPTPAARDEQQRTFADVWHDAATSVKSGLSIGLIYARAYLPVVLLLILLLVLFVVGARGYQGVRRSRLLLNSPPQERITWVYRRMRELLATTGVADEPQVAAKEFIQRLPDSLSHVRADAEEIAGRYTVARFGGRDVTAEDADELMPALQRLRKGIKRRSQ